MEKLLSKLGKRLPSIKFVEASNFYWSPKTSTVYFNPTIADHPESRWALLHEASHAVKGHTSYKTDVELLKLEVEAWQVAQELAKEFGLKIDDEHVQDCLDTYRDWLYARSTCPACALNSLQIDPNTYQCLNCSTKWSVSQSRFCRPYRMKDRHKKTPSEPNQTVFR